MSGRRGETRPTALSEPLSQGVRARQNAAEGSPPSKRHHPPSFRRHARQ
jgi:hypothetical protein